MGDREGSEEKKTRRRKPSSDQCLPRKKQATEINTKTEILKKLELLRRLLPTKSFFIYLSESQKHNDTNYRFFGFPGKSPLRKCINEISKYIYEGVYVN